MRLPPGAWASIVHRVTGVLLVLALPFVLYILALSLQSAAGFSQARSVLQRGTTQVIVTVLIWMFAQHFFSGLRHLLLDIDIGIDANTARRSAYAVFVLALAVTAAIAAKVVW